MRTRPKFCIVKEQWHRWVAWHPVRVDLPNIKSTQWIWLEIVLRKEEYHPFSMTNSIVKHYLPYIK